MERSKFFADCSFSADVIKAAIDECVDLAGKEPANKALTVWTEDSKWEFDDLHEWLAEYRQAHHGAQLRYTWYSPEFALSLLENIGQTGTNVSVTASDRPTIQRIMALFESKVAESQVLKPSPVVEAPRIFLGHGRSLQWRDLKDHLHDVHGHEVEAYEVGSRAGHTIRDILEEMLTRSSFAILVMTGEDETADGHLRARQNVIHETGLFQGKLGFARAIVLLEEGTEDYSNLQGLHQIRYSKGNIKETYGEILGVLRREFGDR